MIVAIAGGNLQGVEAVYLAKKAGWETLVLDKHPHPPASGLCDRFIQIDVIALASVVATLKNHLIPDTEYDDGVVHKTIEAIQRADFILPALENDAALAALVSFSDTHKIPLAYCPEAYNISSSKVKSDALFAKIGIPAPIPWPACGFPAIGKPDSASGSDGITIFHSQEAWDLYSNHSSNKLNHQGEMDGGRHRGNEAFDGNDGQDHNNAERPPRSLSPAGTSKITSEQSPLPVMQQYIEGPSYSMEVMGLPGHYVALETTELFMDEMYDCCRVTAPVPLSQDLVQQFEQISIDLATAVNLKGIMDVEVILHDGKLKVLEIDARIPSQTPTAVYHATGINMVQILGEIFVNNRLPSLYLSDMDAAFIPQHVSYEHLHVTVPTNHETKTLTFGGEHIMSIGQPLFLKTDFFGADEAITNYRTDCSQFVATLIFTGNTPETVEAKRRVCFHKIQHAEP